MEKDNTKLCLQSRVLIANFPGWRDINNAKSINTFRLYVNKRARS